LYTSLGGLTGILEGEARLLHQGKSKSLRRYHKQGIMETLNNKRRRRKQIANKGKCEEESSF
jgi:hypothetical protein